MRLYPGDISDAAKDIGDILYPIVLGALLLYILDTWTRNRRRTADNDASLRAYLDASLDIARMQAEGTISPQDDDS